MTNTCRIADITIGPGHPLAIIAGPCVLEGGDVDLVIARELAVACSEVGLPLVFKASFDKANRTSLSSNRGPGLKQGLESLASIKSMTGLPVCTDIHEPGQAAAAGDHVDLLQVPAFLCRQTDLLTACAKTGRAVNVKKGQFLSPQDMQHVVAKLEGAGCQDMMLTERGTFFGYHRLVNDFIGLGDLMELGRPVCFDVTHSTQLPGAGDGQSGGRPDRADLLARAATASGVHALFIECHPDPPSASSDAATVLPLSRIHELLGQVAAIRRALESGQTTTATTS
ncbi:MAG: 3-deoxy-8-phosphooctulonate synthase [Planctomycetota bacterium]|nr:3-deoxy-8-phosphooctulonate synthase [Planctomycetota bacterium]